MQCNDSVFSTKLPHMTILSDQQERCGDSGGFTDTWRGRHRMKKVALKAFRAYPLQDLKEAEKVRAPHDSGERCFHFSTALVDPMEGGVHMEEVVS